MFKNKIEIICYKTMLYNAFDMKIRLAKSYLSLEQLN